jgi:hypothetical protein
MIPKHLHNNVIESNYAELLNTVKSFGCNNLQFSIFDTIEYSSTSSCKDWKIKHPDILSTNPVFQGECRFCVSYWRITDQPIYFTLENPTWKDIIVALDKVMGKGDSCGVFLENIYIKKDKFGLEYYGFGIGS